jgi:DNA excision repair protein ERCC-5
MQELLRLFGIPFVSSPMEAESQCAFLKQSKLVDGIVTNDSDVFLFGGDQVFRNMFKLNKQVELYAMDDVKRNCDLDREQLVKMAQLLGSDYCEGVIGVGPALAREIIQLFPSLEVFRRWMCGEQDPAIPNEIPAKVVRRKCLW